MQAWIPFELKRRIEENLGDLRTGASKVESLLGESLRSQRSIR
jgi:hypothetical protein